MDVDMKRLAGYLPDPVYEYLDSWANEENRSLSSLVGFLLERAVRDRQKERGEVMSGQSDPLPEYKSLGQVVMHNLTKLVDSSKFPNGRLKELMSGAAPTEIEILRIALICGLTEEYVSSLPLNGGANAKSTSRVK